MSTHTHESMSVKDVLRSPAEAIKHIAPDEVVDTVMAIPDRVKTELRERPYRTLAVAVGVGIGIGVVASSRVARFLIWNLGGYAATELARRGAKRYLERVLAA